MPNVCGCHIKRKGRGSASITVAAAELAVVAGTVVGARRHGSMAAHEQGDGGDGGGDGGEVVDVGSHSRYRPPGRSVTAGWKPLGPDSAG